MPIYTKNCLTKNSENVVQMGPKVGPGGEQSRHGEKILHCEYLFTKGKRLIVLREEQKQLDYKP